MSTATSAMPALEQALKPQPCRPLRPGLLEPHVAAVKLLPDFRALARQLAPHDRSTQDDLVQEMRATKSQELMACPECRRDLQIDFGASAIRRRDPVQRPLAELFEAVRAGIDGLDGQLGGRGG